jgi:hypothetical protein
VKLVIRSDHAGFPLKEDLRATLVTAGHEVVDLGAYKVEPEDDCPDFAEKVGEEIKARVAPRGIHDPNFLHLLWERIAPTDRKALAPVRTGEENTNVAEWDIESPVPIPGSGCDGRLKRSVAS